MSKPLLARFGYIAVATLLCGLFSACHKVDAASTPSAPVTAAAAQSETAPPVQRDPNRPWCGEHGVYEDECALCNPDLARKKAAEPRDPNRPWCEEHGVYEDECVLCNPDLAKKKAAEPRDPNRPWCEEHGVYEDECALCNPDLARKKADEPRDPNRLWCNEHGVYEDECLLCHPELAQKKEEADSSHGHAPAPALACTEHDLLETECGICHPERIGSLAVGEGLKIRFVSGDSTSKAGIISALPVAATSDGSKELLGQVTFNENRLASVTPLTAGVVIEVFKEAGDDVEAGELLATLRSGDLAAIRSEYQKALAEADLAHRTVAREQDLYKRQISARQDLEAAQAAASVAQSAVAESRQHLLSLGLEESEIEAGKPAGKDGATLPIRAPFAGTLIERKAIRGTAAEPGDVLFQLADLSSMWMQLSVPEELLASVQGGEKVAARFAAYPGLAFEGELRWISPSVDPATRMLQARAELTNPQGMLKDGLFGRATLAGLSGASSLSLPEGAVQDVDGKKFVFRKLEADLFEARRVEVGASEGGRIALLAGLAPGEEVVTEGSYIVKSELLKARLGAGCADE